MVIVTSDKYASAIRELRESRTNPTRESYRLQVWNSSVHLIFDEAPHGITGTTQSWTWRLRWW
jgi:hypothetical protein